MRFFCLADREGMEVHDGLEVRTVPRAGGAWARLRAVQAALADFLPDCVLQRCSGMETWVAARYARSHGKRFVFLVAHEIDVAPFSPPRFLHWRWFLYRRGLLAADHIVVQSEEQARALRRGWGLGSTVIRSFQPPPEPPRADKEGVLWIGRAIEFKRPERFLDLAERLPGIPFTLILNPTHRRRYSRRLRERAESLPNVRHIPYVPYAQVMEHFHAARLLVGTSEAEGFPNTYLQAFRASTPVLSLKVDPDGIIRREGLGFVAGGNFDRLASEAKRRYDDLPWIAETGRRARAYVLNHHYPDQIGDQWARLLERVLAR
jgi:glycosyltransferase involved in cell wall biosynthesis